MKQYIAIEGCIGAGKTELAQLLHSDWGGDLVLEHFSENKFLPLFYQQPELYAFHVELKFLTDRYEQISAYQEKIENGENFVIADYFFDKSFIFSDNNLRGDELELYHKLFHFLQHNLQKPDIVIYLQKSAAHLSRNIKKRGRPYEQNIQEHYLDEIQSKYLAYLKNIKEYPVLIIDTEELDFVARPEDYVHVKSLLEAHMKSF